MTTTFDLHLANERRGDTPNHVKVTCRHVMFTADEKCQPLRNLLYVTPHFLCNWLNTVRTLTQSNLRSIFSNGRNIIQPMGKLTITYRHVTGTRRHVTEKHCRTDYQNESSCNCSKVIAVRYLNSNSQMDRRGLVLDSKWEIFYTITFA